MVKVRLDWDEWWPVYSVKPDDGYGSVYGGDDIVDVPQDLLDRQDRILKEFKELQKELEHIVQLALGAKHE